MKSVTLFPDEERKAFKDILLKLIIFILRRRVFLDNDVFGNLGSVL